MIFDEYALRETYKYPEPSIAGGVVLWDPTRPEPGPLSPEMGAKIREFIREAQQAGVPLASF